MKRCIKLACTAALLLLPASGSLAEEAKPERQRPFEGELESFLGEPKFDLQPLFDDERFPNITVTLDGTVLATWGNQHVRARRSEDGGKSWGEEITIAESGFQGGGTIVDETSGDVLAFVEAHHPPAPLTIFRSQDQGKTWRAQQETMIKPDNQGHVPSMHMNEHGITLRHGPHTGRLLRPTRYYAAGNKREEWPNHYSNAIYSDDGGKTWQTSEPFPEKGTGEAALAELSDGRIYYNSRVHWQERPKNTRRRQAWSDDGGQTWQDWSVVEVLPDGHQHRSYGCMGGLVRLPVAGKDVLIFSNIDTPHPRRERATVWASFDGGKSWPLKRLVHAGPSAYSSLTAGRPGTPSEGWIYLHFESGNGSQVARFNLAWLGEGEATGDGEPPGWLNEKAKPGRSPEDRLPSVAVPGQAGYLAGELIYPLEGRATPQCHASTIVETPSGLVAAWFGGTHENNPDVGIWLSRHNGTSWSQPVEIVDGSEGEDQEYACWNPVLFQPQQGPLMLFYKVGVNPRLWWGMLVTSSDAGETWSTPRRLGQNEALPKENQNLLGPVKNKPIQLDNGDILCPSSTENEGWKVHFERTTDLGKTWEVIGPIHDASRFNAIQPSILTYPDERMQILCRTRESVIAQSWSEDSGETWGPMTATELPNPNAGTDAVTLSDGRQLLVYNHTVRGGEFPAGRSQLNVAISRDGKAWTPVLTLEREENAEFSYPAVIQTTDGRVQITYTWKRRSVRHVVLDPRALP